MMKGKFKFKEVPLKLIEIEEHPRTRKVEENIEPLMESIRHIGLIHPLTVYRRNSKYRLLAGLRRLIALKKLGWKNAPVVIIPEPSDIEKAKIFLSESHLSKKLTMAGMVEIVKRFFAKYASVKTVAEELGLEEDMVRDMLGIIGIEKDAPKVAEEVKKKKIDEPNISWIDYGKKAVNASVRPDGIVDEKKALKLLPEIRLLPKAAQRKRLVEFAKENPDATVEEIVEEAKKPPRITKLSVDISTDLWERLRKASKTEEKDEDMLVEIVLTDWLRRRGY